jgi:hypothetical protein
MLLSILGAHIKKRKRKYKNQNMLEENKKKYIYIYIYIYISGKNILECLGKCQRLVDED